MNYIIKIMNNEILKKTYGKQIIPPVKVSGKEIAKKRLKMYNAKKKHWQKAKKNNEK